MDRNSLGRAVLLLSLAALLALPASAGAVLSGTNGRIAFASGRVDDNDALAKLYLRTTIGSAGGGSAGATITPTGGIQHRHPTWSPDRTKIAYAAGPNATANYDIFILDLTTPGATPQNITNSDSVTDDRPAWSPDGTRIAYESEVADGSGQTDVLVQTLPIAAGPANLTNTGAAGAFEGKPAWTPDSQTIYYVTGNPMVANAANIVKKPATGGAQTVGVPDSGISEFQPSISPDGTKICYTLGTAFDGSADIAVGPVGSAGLIITTDNQGSAAANGDYNCTWSPDGTKIAYVRGTFSLGALVMENSDNTQLTPITLEDDAGNFDGNPDWAPDGRPSCQNKTVAVTVNTPTAIALDCPDTGPGYEQTNVLEDITVDPTHGTLGDVQDGNPDTVTYTPNASFQGTDSFEVRSRDDFAFGSQRGTVTVNVVPKPQSGPGGGGSNVAPVISNLKVSKRIHKGTGLPRLKSTKSGTSISFTLSEDAKVTLTFERKSSGRRVRRNGRNVCVKQTPANRRKRKCTRFRKAGSAITLEAKKGANRVVFQGRTSQSKSLSLGSYRLTALARDSANAKSKSRRANFRLRR